jgi:hypothetical protein
MNTDELGFPLNLTAKQSRRIKTRAFASANQWAARFSTTSAALAAPRAELVTVVLSHGIAPALRPQLWYEVLQGLPASSTSSEAYSTLVARTDSLPEATRRQIDVDLPRTFAEQRLFKESLRASEGARAASATSPTPVGGSGARRRPRAGSGGDSGATSVAPLPAAWTSGSSIHDKLRRVLAAYCVAHPATGYLQSMNFIAGLLLLVFEQDEARAFAMLELLTLDLLAGYYTGDMDAMRADCDVFAAVLRNRQPDLCAHLQRLGLDDVAALFLPRWLLCLFLNCFPAAITLRVWDALMLAGASGEAPRFLLEVALALFSMCSEPLLGARSFGEAVEVLKSIGSRVDDAAELLLLTRAPECTLQHTTTNALRAMYAPGFTAPRQLGQGPRRRSSHAAAAASVGDEAAVAGLGIAPRETAGSATRRFSPLPAGSSPAVRGRSSLLVAAGGGREPLALTTHLSPAAASSVHLPRGGAAAQHSRSPAAPAVNIDDVVLPSSFAVLPRSPARGEHAGDGAPAAPVLSAAARVAQRIGARRNASPLAAAVSSPSRSSALASASTRSPAAAHPATATDVPRAKALVKCGSGPNSLLRESVTLEPLAAAAVGGGAAALVDGRHQKRRRSPVHSVSRPSSAAAAAAAPPQQAELDPLVSSGARGRRLSGASPLLHHHLHSLQALPPATPPSPAAASLAAALNPSIPASEAKRKRLRAAARTAGARGGAAGAAVSMAARAVGLASPQGTPLLQARGRAGGLASPRRQHEGPQRRQFSTAYEEYDPEAEDGDDAGGGSDAAEAVAGEGAAARARRKRGRPAAAVGGGESVQLMMLSPPLLVPHARRVSAETDSSLRRTLSACS